jgi:hypothetical protein
MSASNTNASNRESNDPQRVLPEHVRRRQRAVAEREASRLARPERPLNQSLPHANREISAVTSTPSGFGSFKRTINNPDDTNEKSSEWCGPFSVARQMIATREEARRRREKGQEVEEKKNAEKHPLDAIVRMAEIEKNRKANPSLTWKAKKVDDKDFTGKTSNLYYKRQKRYKEQSTTTVRFGKIPTLYDLCVKFLVENFDLVETLGPMVDSSIRREICGQLVACGKMNGAAFDTLAEVGSETLEITDCTQVTQEQMVEALEQLMPAGLRALLLTHCGRCFGARAVDTITKSNVNDLFAISICGAYVLKDADAARIIERAAKTLSSIEFKACPLIGMEFCNSISTHFSSEATSHTPLLELSLHDVRLARDDLKMLTKSDALRNLKSISLCGMDALDDPTLVAILDATNGSLEGIDLNNSIHLTDESLSGIRRCNTRGKLQALKLSGIKNFTAAGLEAFFTFGISGLPNPPILHNLDLSELDFESLTETVIDLAITVSASKHSAKAKEGKSVDMQGNSGDLLSALGGIISLDVSGSNISDKNLESLSSLCCTTLKELKINFCPNVTNKGIGYLVAQCASQLSSIHIWGNAQISDDFLDGHDRIGSDSSLQIEGAWMKQSGCRSQR